MVQHNNNTRHQQESNKHESDETGHWRLGPHGHLRSGARPVSIDELKKKRMTKSMIIGLVSLVVAFALAIAVFLIVQPEGTAGNSGAAVNTEEGSTGEGSSSAQDQTGASGNEGSKEGGNAQDTNSSKNAVQEPASKGNKVNVNQLPDSSFLYDTDIAELAKADTFNDGQTVQVKGEVVGDAINDEGSAALSWITLQDDDELNPNTISILVNGQHLSNIDSYGRYGQQGSILQIRGTYHLACADHQGLSDIHAEDVQLLSEGKKVETPINPVIITAAVISVFLGCALLIMYSIRRERMR